MDEGAETQGGESKAISSQPRDLTVSSLDRGAGGRWVYSGQCDPGPRTVGEGEHMGLSSLDSGPQPIPAAHGQNDQGRCLGPGPQLNLDTLVTHPWKTAGS